MIPPKSPPFVTGCYIQPEFKSIDDVIGILLHLNYALQRDPCSGDASDFVI